MREVIILYDFFFITSVMKGTVEVEKLRNLRCHLQDLFLTEEKYKLLYWQFLNLLTRGEIVFFLNLKSTFAYCTTSFAKAFIISLDDGIVLAVWKLILFSVFVLKWNSQFE